MRRVLRLGIEMQVVLPNAVRLLLFAVIAATAADSPKANTASAAAAAAAQPHNPLFPVMAPTTILKEGCPRREDIHPCECLEIPRSDMKAGDSPMETVAFCKTIRNAQVLQNAMKGMQGHTIDFMVLDSCKLPPFPNGLFFNVGIKWMEIINSTVQMRQNFFECASNCW